METRIRCHHYKDFLNDGRDSFEPLEEGPSYLRLVCRITVRYALRRLGGGGLAVAEPVGGKSSRTRTHKSKHPVDDPSDFLNYDKTRWMVFHLFTRLRRLRRLDLAPNNWSGFTPGVMADDIRREVRDNENKGMCGGHYRFTISMDVEVMHVFSEPKALLHYCSEDVMQTGLDPAASSDPCAICLDGLMSSSRTPPVNLPCGHAFHSQCITKWFFKGTACPLCRHDLRGLVAAPWVSSFEPDYDQTLRFPIPAQERELSG
ncbi:unnamed protein product [Urochloa humidicola]